MSSTIHGGTIAEATALLYNPPMSVPSRSRVGGPLLVALGSAGWGAENLFRKRLDDLRLPSYSIVLFEHVLQVVFTLPWLLRNLAALRTAPRRALVYVFLSGAIGSSLGTVCYTAALDTVNPTVAAVLLNLQPVVSTIAGALLFAEKIEERFYAWAAIAVLAGVAIALPNYQAGGQLGAEGLTLVFATIGLWGFATAAGRGAMRELPLGLATPLRLWAGLVTTAGVIGVRALLGKGGLDAAPFFTAPVVESLLLLTTLTGVIPLFVYFAGLATTPASIAGYCEMLYTVSATFVSWKFLGGTMTWEQAAASAVLIGAIIQLNRVHRAEAPAAGAPLRKVA